MTFVRNILLGIAALALSYSCISEDRSNCFGNVYLHFVYNGDVGSDIFPSKIEGVNFYLYQEGTNTPILVHTYDKERLDQQQGTHLSLHPGNYRAVCWGNPFDRTRIDASLSSAHVAEPAWFGQTDDYSGTDSLYFSTVWFTVPDNTVDVYDTCHFASSHIDMLVKLDGFVDAVDVETGQKAEVVLSQEGCPVATDFDNVPFSQRCEVFPPMIVDPDDPDAYLLKYNVLRFSGNDTQPALRLRFADGRDIHTIPLHEFISRYSIRVDDRQEVFIGIRIYPTSQGVAVENFDVIDVNPGWE